MAAALTAAARHRPGSKPEPRAITDFMQKVCKHFDLPFEATTYCATSLLPALTVHPGRW